MPVKKRPLYPSQEGNAKLYSSETEASSVTKFLHHNHPDVDKKIIDSPEKDEPEKTKTHLLNEFDFFSDEIDKIYANSSHDSKLTYNKLIKMFENYKQRFHDTYIGVLDELDAILSPAEYEIVADKSEALEDKFKVYLSSLKKIIDNQQPSPENFNNLTTEIKSTLPNSDLAHEAQTAPAPPGVPFVNVGPEPEHLYLPKVDNIKSTEDENLILKYLNENLNALDKLSSEHENKKLVGYIRVYLPGHKETIKFRVTGDFAAKIKRLQDEQIKLRGIPYAGSVSNILIDRKPNEFVDKFIFIETQEQNEKLLNKVQSEIEKENKSMYEFIDLSGLSVISSTTPDNKIETFYSIKLNLDDNGFKTYNVPEKTLEEIKSLMEKRRIKIQSKIFNKINPLVINQENESPTEMINSAEITQNLTRTLESLILKVEPIEEDKIKKEILSASRMAMIGDAVTLTPEQQETGDLRFTLVSNTISRHQTESKLSVDKKRKKLPAKALLFLSGVFIMAGVIWYGARYYQDFDKNKPDKVTKKAEPPQSIPPEVPSQPLPDQTSEEGQNYLSYESPVEDVPSSSPNESQALTPEKINMQKFDPNALTIPEVGKSSEEDLINFQRALNEQAKKIKAEQNVSPINSSDNPTNEGNNNPKPKK